MYYPDEVVEEVRSRADIVDVIGGYVNLKKKGANYFGLCPFHGEKTPSFSVSPGKQMFYCFGCGKGGDVVRFLMEYENITFVEAIQKLADQEGYKLPETAEEDPARRQENDLKLQLLEVNKQAAVYFYASLKSEQGKLGMQYLKKRQLTDETITHFGLGYADQTRDGLYRYLRSKGFKDEVLRESGLITFSERGVYDKFFNRVMFPILDFNNRVIGFGGRVMGQGEPKYLNSPETKLFDKSRNLYGLNFAKKSREKFMIVCEGYMDVISMHQAGFINAVASLGTALTEQQARLLKRYVPDVLLTYDSDGAGVKAAKRAIPIFKDAGIETKVINMRPYKDPDEFMKALGREEFRKRIDSAENSFLWSVNAEKQSYNMSDPAGQTAFFQQAAAMLAEFREPLERENYIKAVAREQMIDYDNLKRLVNRIGGEKSSLYGQKTFAQTSLKPKPDRKQTESAAARSEKQLVTWLSEKPELIGTVSKYISADDIKDDTMREVLKLVYAEEPVNRILDRFRDQDEVYERVAGMFNGNLLSDDTDEFEFKRGLEDVIRNIRMASLNEKISRETDPEKLTELFREQSDLQNLKL